ncbi:M14 family zinc carboxypeptidase [Aliikangiella sp. IMCC44359]|uniref:M14 family zinc carboxypeptidase n=1 Tax=Aliikangiella sp. IMCC44359 TaxID=3459125 RepID=UPI00403B2418
MKKASKAFLKSKMLMAALMTVSSTTMIQASEQNISTQSQAASIQLSHELSQEISTENIYRVYFPNEEVADKAIISFHGQLLESNKSEGYLVMELSEDDIKKLKQFDFSIKKADEYIKQRNNRLKSIQQEVLSGNSVWLNSAGTQSIPNYSCYETVEETFSAAQSLANSNSNIAEWIDIGDSWEKKNNYGGYDLQVLKITNKSISGNKPKLFVNSAIHAREYATAPLNLTFAKWLIEGYNNNPDATWLVDHHEIHLLLQTNPDGRKKAEGGLSWRKNTNRNYCGSTSNSRGADLNRNFTFFWNYGNGSSGDQCSETYRGASAASEPEVNALQNYVRSLFPDKRGPSQNDAAPLDTQGIHIDIHSYGELILWPWGHTSNTAPNASGLQTLGRKFAYFNGYDPKQAIGLYPTDGTSDNVSYGELGVPAYTFELGTSFFQSCSVFENDILPDVLPALIYAAKVVRAPYVLPSGPDSQSITINGQGNMGYIKAGEMGTLSASVTDIRFSNRRGTESTQNITAAEYYINVAPWENNATAIAMTPQDGSYNSKTETVTAQIDTTGLPLGKHIIYVRSKDASGTWGATSAIFLMISNDDPIPANQLENGVPKTGLSGSSKEQLFFTMNVPAGATNLRFNTNGGTGDADLYVKFGSQPTLESFDCKSTTSTSTETCELPTQVGTFHIMVEAWNAISGVSLVGQYDITDPDEYILENGVAKKGIGDTQNNQKLYTFEVPADAQNIKIDMSGGTGDADMYVKFGSAPTENDYDCRPYAQGNNESCEGEETDGTYYVLIKAYTDYSGVSLLGSFVPPVGDAEPIEWTENITTLGYGQWSHFTETLVPGYQTLTVTMSGGTGDVDLYLRHGAESTPTAYDCRPYKDGNEETCTIDLPDAGTWYIDLFGYSKTGSSDVSLSLSAIPKK